MWRLAAVGLATVTWVGRADAQCPTTATTASNVTTATATICMQVKDVLRLTTSSTLATPSNLTKAQYTATATSPAASTYVPFPGFVTLQVAANRAFEVTVTGAFSGPGAKSASDALWSVSSGVFTNTARNVSAANASANRTIPFLTTPGPNAAWSQNVFFASRWVYETDRAGAYNLQLTFTLAAK